MAFSFFAIVRRRLVALHLDSGDSGPLVAVEPKAEFATLFGMMKASDLPASRVVDGVPILAPGEDIGELLR